MIGINSVLIVGGYGTLTRELVNKLNKEGWRIFTLVSDPFASKPAYVFEQYRFGYESDNMNDILASCRPDVILFTGAYDPSFTWTANHEVQDSCLFIAGLNNLLICAREQGTRHFVYLSSDCVYQDSHPQNIHEEIKPSPSSIKAITIAQGEALAIAMGSHSSLEVTVARVASMYFIPQNHSECRDPLTLLCLDALIRGRVKVNAQIVYAPLYIGDAVHALFLLFSVPLRRHHIYHISSEQEITAASAAQIIEAASARPVTVIDETKGLKKRTVLSGRRFAEEFDFQARTAPVESIPRIVLYMEGHRRQFDTPRRQGGLFLGWLGGTRKALAQLFPFVECVAVFFVFFIADSFAAGVPYLQGVNFYLLFVLLFAVIRGRVLAIVAFALATGGHFYQQMCVRGALDLVTGVDIYIWVAELFLVGIVAGHLRDRLVQLRQEKEEEHNFLTNRIKNISFINDTNTKMKNYFQEKVINSNESIGWFYDIISQLDQAGSAEVIFIASDFISRVMDCKNVAIYRVSDGSYCRLMASTTPRARSLGKSIYMKERQEFFQLLKDGQVFINRALDKDLPSMASALADTEGRMRVIFFLWDLPYERKTLYHTNTLKLLGSLVNNAMFRAANYLEAIASTRLVPGTRILQEDAFVEMWSIYERTSSKQLIEYSMLQVPAGGLPLAEWSEKLGSLLRQEDIIGLLPGQNLGILLTNTPAGEAEPILNRMKAAGIAVSLAAE